MSQQYSSDGDGADRQQQYGQYQPGGVPPYGPPPQYGPAQGAPPAGYQQNPYTDGQYAPHSAQPPQGNPYNAPQPHQNGQNPYLQQPAPAQRDGRKFAGGIAMVVFGALLLLARISNAVNGTGVSIHDNAERIGYTIASAVMLVVSISLILRGIRLISRSKR